MSGNMAQARPVLPLGGRYEVEGFLRPGRYGDLWRARAIDDGSPVVVKLLKPELFKDGEAIRRFQREVRLLLAFEHPHVLRVLDHGTTDGGDPFVVVEDLGQGRLLTDVVDREAPLPLDRVRAIGVPIARVLAAAAARGIVHRGLSPEAILVAPGEDASRPWIVKVFDFGLAIVFLGEAEDPAGLDVDGERLTDYGQRIGDPRYMAPEYVAAFESGAACDVYALGVLLFELATGEPPFRGRAMDVLEAHVSIRADRPSDRIAGIPAWFDALLGAMLDKDPLARPDATGVARCLVHATWPPPTEATGPIAQR